jgi:hypothetical protein
VQVPPAVPVHPALQVQFVRAALPAGELEFDGQAMHVEFAEAPTAVEYVPASQPMHAAHTPVAAVAVLGYVPAPQTEHAADPVDALYFPTTHAMHVPPSGPVHPALHVQFVRAALPAGELEFDGQAMHVEVAVAPTAVEYVPAPQLVHRAAPGPVEYVPAPQTVLRQTANTPVPAPLPSEVKTTSRYPVDDV